MNIKLDKKTKENLVKRFLHYVKINTTSKEGAKTVPSSQGQMKLLKILADEMRELGLQDVHLHKDCIATGILPSNVEKKLPTVAFIAHIDTSPDVNGNKIKPIIHKKYDGEKIILPEDKKQILDPTDLPELKKVIGHDLITSDGTTLLGSDDKAGVAEIMTAIEHMTKNKEIKHGNIRVCFLPDEEIGLFGAEILDFKKLKIDFAYTLDGGLPGEIEIENFNADKLTIKFKGIMTHPGQAKGKMVNPIKVASACIEKLPKKSLSPETTTGKHGYIFPFSIKSRQEIVEVVFILRDFYLDGLKKQVEFVKKIAKEATEEFAGSSFEFELEEQYRNMLYTIEKNPQIVEIAIKAMEDIGIKPYKSSIRGGTDGAMLSYRGLPTPNLFSGQNNIHSPKEWISVQHMELAVKTVIKIAEKINLCDDLKTDD